MTFYDGNSNKSPIIGSKICGDLSDVASDIISTSNEVFIQFKTDGSENKKGFEIEYKPNDGRYLIFIKNALMNKNILWNLWLHNIAKDQSLIMFFQGKIKSPGFPQNYANQMDETWLIEVHPGQQVYMKFLSFDVEKATNCQ